MLLLNIVILMNTNFNKKQGKNKFSIDKRKKEKEKRNFRDKKEEYKDSIILIKFLNKVYHQVRSQSKEKVPLREIHRYKEKQQKNYIKRKII